MKMAYSQKSGQGIRTAAVMKALYLRTLDVAAKWVMPYPNWGIIRGKLDLLWGIRWDA